VRPALIGFATLALACCAPVSFASASSTCAAPHLNTLPHGFRYGLPPHVQNDGLRFASTDVPISRADVRERILKEINLLLLDRRSRVSLWLTRADALRPIIGPILKMYDMPPEFIYLAAIESSYDSRALSSAGAYGFWQFIKSTASCGPKGCDQYDWRMNITGWKDDRADLVCSTHAAARYLAWMNRVKKISLDGKPERDGFNDWFLTAAAYNAGPARVIQRLNSFGTESYWDVPLPTETEKYVPRWIAIGIISKNREFYGIQAQSLGTVAFDTVEKIRLSKDLTFAAMARLLDTTPRVVWALNSQIPAEKSVFPARSNRAPISHTIRVPKGSAKKFLAQLAAHGYTKK
jgi:membrane-bound lytic murein transglycosylase D